jgi:hypothetical protein
MLDGLKLIQNINNRFWNWNSEKVDKKIKRIFKIRY